MEVQNVSNKISSTKEIDDDDIPLPGFRFHPTDEELVGFYLKRKVEKIPMKIELIKQADIYKYDPWDLPKSSTLGDNNKKEWYLYCKRGRKYRNSIRPNRVTVSGFWKATGIDKPIYSSSSKCIIGLKKSLVYYRGFAGKGTKTDWMMHEFRLPPTQNVDAKTVDQEAEVWTICRILKRNINSYSKCTPDHNRREVSTKNTIINPFILNNSSSKINHEMSYNISFNSPQIIKQNDEEKPYFSHTVSSSQASSDFSSSFSKSMCSDMNQLLRHADWEDLCSIVHSSAGATITANPLYF